jgi:GWxTD domain-containing protein
MADGRPGRRLNLRLFSLGAALSLCSILFGCLSVSIDTEVNWNGGGTRSYQYQIDTGPERSSQYRTGPLRMADLGLDGIPGVTLVDSSVQSIEGGTISRLTCRADDLRRISQDDDSLYLDIKPMGLWVYYRYRESYNLDMGREDPALAQMFSSKRFRHRLRLPGRIIKSNSDSMAGGWAVWNRPMFGGKERLVMEAESRIVNPIFPVLGGILLGIIIAGFFWRRPRKAEVKAAAVLCLLLIMAGASRAIGRRPGERFDPEQASQGSIRFHVQTAQFRGTPEKAWIEISYALPVDNLQFVKADSTYRARYSISILAFDRRGRQAGGDIWERGLNVADYSSIGRDQQVLSDTLRLDLAPGSYRLKVICTDNNSERQGTIERQLTVGDFFSSPLTAGGVRFERSTESGFMPWAQRTYGGQFGPVVAYLRLYAAKEESVAIDLRLEGRGHQKGTAVSRKMAAEGEVPIRLFLPVDSLEAGDYRLDVTARSLFDPERTFYQTSESVTIRREGSAGQASLETSLELLSYIASRQELRQLESAAAEARDSAFEAFWRGRDPTPGTARNEARDDFYQRVEQANRQYSLGVRPGWRTDRGRIYIKYGPPDEVERHPFEPDYQAYEIWYYYNDGVRFLFMDVHGFGDYRLMNPKAERK